MKRVTSTGTGTDVGRAQELRRQAEEMIPDAPAAEPERATLLPADAQRVLHELQVHQIELELQNEELRQAQGALESARARYFDLYELAPVGYFTLDENGLILEANLTGANLLGAERDSLVNQPFLRFVVRDDADSFYLRSKQLFKTRTPLACELRLLRKSGTTFTAWLEATVAQDGPGVAVCRAVLSDISEHKAIQEKLRHGQSLLQTAGAMALMGGWAIKLPDNELTWSDEICAMLEFPKGTVPPLAQALSLYPAAAYEIISSALRSCGSDGTPFDCELEIFTVKGRRLDVRAIGKPVRDAYGRIIGIEGAFQDITSQKKNARERESLEMQLRESQKMEALGTLAGGVAHDFNNILGTILGNVELARHDAAANWQALVSLDEIQKAGHRARDLVQQILSFSRSRPTARRVLSLTAVVEESVRLLRAALPGSVRVEYRCAADAPAVVADPSQVQQVLLNLGNNAAYAMEDRSGTIDIRIEGPVPAEAAARSQFGLRPGRYVRVVVSDTGHGMDPTTLRRIFEPFFTTKPAGKGTGLGLAVVHGIMQAHEGAIVAYSEPGKGSRFELYFPSASEATSAIAPPEVASPTSEGRGQHIVYIEDDDSQLFMMKRKLERWGYRVSAYAEQREALGALLAGAQQVDLVVTDFNMPGLSGLELARTIRIALPEIPMIVISGYVTDALRADAAAAGINELISKPHEIEEFRDMVYRLLAPRQAIRLDPV